MSFVAAIALCSSSAIARLSPRTRGRTCFLPHGTFARMSLAACGETRLNVDCRKPFTSWLFDSRARSISAPSSTPCGCGLISAASFGSSSAARGNVSVSLPGPVGGRTLRGGDGPRVVDRRVRVREGGVLDVAVHEALALLPVRDDLELDARAVLLVPLRERLVVDDDGLVLPRVELDVEHVGGLRPSDAARDADRLAGRDLAVHRGRRDADALLAAALLQAVELRAVEQLPEDLRHLLLDDARAVVLNDHQEAALALRQLRVLRRRLEREVVDLDRQLGQDAGLLAGVERVVDGLLDRREEGLRRVVEAEEVAVLREELGDRDLALLLGERLGGGPRRARRGCRRFGLRGCERRLRRRWRRGGATGDTARRTAGGVFADLAAAPSAPAGLRAAGLAPSTNRSIWARPAFGPGRDLTLSAFAKTSPSSFLRPREFSTGRPGLFTTRSFPSS